jgi:hypothetical protein
VLAAPGDWARNDPGLDVISADQIALNVAMFDPGKMNQDRSGANADRIVVAQLTGEARHRARWRPLTGEEEAAALAELRALAGGRAARVDRPQTGYHFSADTRELEGR